MSAVRLEHRDLDQLPMGWPQRVSVGSDTSQQQTQAGSAASRPSSSAMGDGGRDRTSLLDRTPSPLGEPTSPMLGGGPRQAEFYPIQPSSRRGSSPLFGEPEPQIFSSNRHAPRAQSSSAVPAYALQRRDQHTVGAPGAAAGRSGLGRFATFAPAWSLARSSYPVPIAFGVALGWHQQEFAGTGAQGATTPAWAQGLGYSLLAIGLLAGTGSLIVSYREAMQRTLCGGMSSKRALSPANLIRSSASGLAKTQLVSLVFNTQGQGAALLGIVAAASMPISAQAAFDGEATAARATQLAGRYGFAVALGVGHAVSRHAVAQELVARRLAVRELCAPRVLALAGLAALFVYASEDRAWLNWQLLGLWTGVPAAIMLLDLAVEHCKLQRRALAPTAVFGGTPFLRVPTSPLPLSPTVTVAVAATSRAYHFPRASEASTEETEFVAVTPPVARHSLPASLHRS